ncbi:MAG: hypothetical protein J1E95_12180 [Muribaculaceae bacterium]|nr:hypothetical protein [Muribaculaceae bacterium]
MGKFKEGWIFEGKKILNPPSADKTGSDGKGDVRFWRLEASAPMRALRFWRPVSLMRKMKVERKMVL